MGSRFQIKIKIKIEIDAVRGSRNQIKIEIKIEIGRPSSVSILILIRPSICRKQIKIKIKIETDDFELPGLDPDQETRRHQRHHE